MSEISISLREANGALREWQGDEALLDKCRALRSQGACGRELIAQIVEIDAAAPPLSVRLVGVDAEGHPFEEFICYAG